MQSSDNQLTEQQTTHKHTTWLICVDDSLSGFFALESARSMVKKNDKIYLLTVGNKHPTWSEMRPMSDTAKENDSKNQEEVRKVLSYYARRIRDLNMEISLIGCTGSPGARICEAVKELKINKVVIGRRSPGFLRSLVSPSTSRYVCDYADCEVILAKEKAGTHAGEEEAFAKMTHETDGELVVKAMPAGGDESSPFSVYALTEIGVKLDTPQVHPECGDASCPIQHTQKAPAHLKDQLPKD